MTEAGWLAGGDPAAMLAVVSGRASPRRLRLFACACCWRLAGMLTTETVAALAVAERLADGEATDAERRAARAAAQVAEWHPGDEDRHGSGPAKWAVSWALARRPAQAAVQAPGPAASAGAMGAAGPDWVARTRAEHVIQAELLRCLFGNPFRLAHFSTAWRTANAVGVAESMYAARDFSAAPVLADALEDAGCDAADVLAHLRGPGPHARGCFAVDLVLGRA